MWRPRDAKKHALLPAAWPTRGVAERARWFSPIAVGSSRLERRTWVPAMVPWRATEEGFVTDEILSWYERFARGCPGAIVVEATGIRDVKSGPLLRIGHDRFLPGLKRLVQFVREASDGRTRLFIQLIDFLRVNRRPPPEKYFARYLTLTDRLRDAVSDRAANDDEVRRELAKLDAETLQGILTARELEALRYGHRERVTDVDLPHVAELPRVLPPIFAEAAARAERAGFDGVELHYAHAYTMASFLSARNDRADGYGSTPAGRVRLPVEVLTEVRRAVGPRFVVGARFLADECIGGGSGVNEAEFYGVELARAGADFLSLSRGGKFEDAKQPKIGWAVYPYTGRSGYECMPTVISDDFGPFGRNVVATSRVRAAVRNAGFHTPIVGAGGVATFEQAERMLRDGVADIVAAARQSLADPDWFEKVRLGLGNEVRRCTFTNYCEALDQMHKQVTCKLWDRVDLDEPGAQLASVGKRRLTAPGWEKPGDNQPFDTADGGPGKPPA